DRKKRVRDIADAWLFSEAMAAGPAGASRSRRVWPWMALAGVLAAVLAVAVWPTSPPGQPLRRFESVLGSDVNLDFAGGPAAVLSPDGERLAYVSTGKGEARRLYTRRLDQAESRAITGTEGADAPFFSPDGRWIGFFAGQKLKKVSVD